MDTTHFEIWAVVYLAGASMLEFRCYNWLLNVACILCCWGLREMSYILPLFAPSHCSPWGSSNPTLSLVWQFSGVGGLSLIWSGIRIWCPSTTSHLSMTGHFSQFWPLRQQSDVQVMPEWHFSNIAPASIVHPLVGGLLHWLGYHCTTLRESALAYLKDWTWSLGYCLQV